MKYWEDKYIETIEAEVTDGGKIKVGKGNFAASSVLKAMDAKAYETGLTEFILSRTEDQLRLADDILEEFGSQERFDLMRQAYNRSAIIPFLGAGMSIPSGYLGWTQFLRRLRFDTSIEELELESLLIAGDYEEAAELLSENLPNGIFDQKITEFYGQDREISGMVQLLPDFFPNAAITTNFDNVVNRVYDSSNQTFAHLLNGTQAEDLPRHLGAGERVLVKLHGNAHSRVSRVLTLTEYNRAYADEESIQHVIEQLCYRTLLFVGCSLAVDRTLRAMKTCLAKKANQGMPAHYAFLAVNDGEDRGAREAILAESNIYPIWYSGDHDECLEALLLKLRGAS